MVSLIFELREYKGSILIGFLSGVLALFLLPASILYVTGLFAYMPLRYGTDVILRYFGSYIWPQAVGYGLLAGILHYSTKIASQVKMNTRRQMRFGFAGALYSTIFSFFSICCAPIGITLIGLLGSGPALLLLLNSGKMAIVGLLIQAAAIVTASRNIIHVHHKGLICDIREDSKAKSEIIGGAIPKPDEHQISRIPHSTSVLILGLILGIVLMGGLLATSPDFERRIEVNTGVIQVHVFDANGQPPKPGLMVRASGPIVGVSVVRGNIALLEGMPPGEYSIEVEDTAASAQIVNLREGGEEHIIITLPP